MEELNAALIKIFDKALPRLMLFDEAVCENQSEYVEQAGVKAKRQSTESIESKVWEHLNMELSSSSDSQASLSESVVDIVLVLETIRRFIIQEEMEIPVPLPKEIVKSQKESVEGISVYYYTIGDNQWTIQTGYPWVGMCDWRMRLSFTHDDDSRTTVDYTFVNNKKHFADTSLITKYRDLRIGFGEAMRPRWIKECGEIGQENEYITFNVNLGKNDIQEYQKKMENLLDSLDSGQILLKGPYRDRRNGNDCGVRVKGGDFSILYDIPKLEPLQ